nr:reverse transcriptase N-terminal domain-containing protein [Pseudomonas arsenicoxydans]
MWLQADWGLIKEEMKRLQGRIAKATMEGLGGKVRAPQHLLTRSHSGKMLATKQVIENRGKRTPGVDGKIWATPAAKWRGWKATAARLGCRGAMRPFRVISPFLILARNRYQATRANFCLGVMPPRAIFRRS